MRDIFWVAPPDSTEPIYVNQAYEDMFGRPAAALRERRWDWLRGVLRQDRASCLLYTSRCV